MPADVRFDLDAIHREFARLIEEKTFNQLDAEAFKCMLLLDIAKSLRGLL